jgi:regulator of protease activity HflC (stomatin/prohibitin superfamily)
MESQFKKWDAEVDKLRAKSAQMSAEARAKTDEQLKAMRANRDAA